MSSRTFSAKVNCGSDHGYTGCSLHSLEVDFHYTSMIVKVTYDGSLMYLPYTVWKQLVMWGMDEHGE